MIRITLQALCSLLFLLISTTQASPVILFEDVGPIDIEHGTFVNTQHSRPDHGGLIISAENGSQGPYHAILSDSRLSNTGNHDLEEPFYLNRNDEVENAVPVPALLWLLGTALLGFIGLSRSRSV
jgi:hypothetical protein